MVVVRAVYRDGKFQPLEVVDLQDGQEVQLQIVEKPASTRELISDLLTEFHVEDTILDEASIMQDLDNALSGKRPLSEIIIEERQDRQ